MDIVLMLEKNKNKGEYMCQSKANGGKRCAYHSKRGSIKESSKPSNKTTANKTLVSSGTVNTETINEKDEIFTCILCNGKSKRAGQLAHHCLAPNLVPISDATQLVLDTIRAVNGRPLLVGGSVRDAILSNGNPHTPKDIDIEVYGIDVETLIACLKPLGYVGDVGRYFSVVKLSIGFQEFDISLPRVDSKVSTGHRGFEVRADHSLDEVSAFGRRDFTVNALGWDPVSGELVDPYGGGADIANKILRHTSDSFGEDPLRVMRGIQFAGRFGFELAPETIEICRSLVDSYGELPLERIWTEWSKIATKASEPSKSLKALFDTGWERHFPELAAIRGVEQGEYWHPEGSVDIHVAMSADKAAEIALRDGLDDEERLVLVLSAIAHDFGKATHSQKSQDGKITSHGHAEAGVEPAKRFLEGIGAPLDIQRRVSLIVGEHMAHAGSNGKPSSAAVRRLIRRLDANGSGVTLQAWARVVEADTAGRGNPKPSPADAWLAKAAELGSTRPARAILRGEHLFEAGLKSGPAYKPILENAIMAQDEGVFDDEVGAKAWLSQYLKDNLGVD